MPDLARACECEIGPCECDISHSSVERFIGPDACITLDFALARLTGVVDKLLVYPDRMLANLNKFKGLVHSRIGKCGPGRCTFLLNHYHLLKMRFQSVVLQARALI